MITELQLQNFKCFKQSPVFEFSKINLLTGVNGRGKSTLLQSILLLTQSVWKNRVFRKLHINGDLVELGNFDDIKNSETPRGKDIRFHIKTNIKDIEQVIFSFREDQSDSLVATISEIALKRQNENLEYHDNSVPLRHTDPKYLNSWNAFQRMFIYIYYVSAERAGPVKYVDKTYQPDSHNEAESII